MTVPDLALQALIARRLAADFPDDPVLAEEDASWLRGESAGVVSAQVVSVVRQVVLDACTEQVIHWIDRGAGKANSRFWTLDPIDGTKGDPSAARVFRSYERQHGDSDRFDRTLSTLGSKVRSIPMDSQAKHVALAAGAGDLLMRFPATRLP